MPARAGPTRAARPTQPARALATTAVLRRLPVDRIDVPPRRLRRDFGLVSDLAYSMGSVGLLQPIQVYAVGDRFRLVAGERRLRAARLLGWTEIDGLVRQPTGDELLLELVENTQRKFLTDAEEADAFIRLVRDQRRGIKEVGAQAGRSEAYVSKRIRVFDDAVLRQAVEQGQLSVSMAEEFLAVAPARRPALVEQAIRDQWDTAQVRTAVHSQADPADDAPPTAPDEPEATARGHLRLATTNPDRPRDLVRSVRALTTTLRGLRPYQLTPADEKALAALLKTLLLLARAHGGAGRSGHVFPRLEDAERAVRAR